MRLGLYQESVERFALAIHADGEPARAFAEFTAGDLRASWAEQGDGRVKLELADANAAIEGARRLVLQRLQNGADGSIEGAVMALDTAGDAWVFTLLRSNMPGYLVTRLASHGREAPTMVDYCDKCAAFWRRGLRGCP